jgi:hypothetical protein
MTLKIELPSELEERLSGEADRRGVPAETLTLELLDEYLPSPGRKAELLSLLKSWVDEKDPTEQRETGEFLMRALDEDRLSDRKLYPADLKGVTW